MKDIDEITNWLKQNLSEKRFDHTLGVAKTAESLAKRWGEDPSKAFLAGLIHDCAKEIARDKAISLLEGYGYSPSEVERTSAALLHAPLGAFFAEHIFEISDNEILNAVRFHTTGRAGMSIMEKVIYVADFIEPNRCYDVADEIRAISYDDIDKAVLKGTDASILFTIRRGAAIHPDTILARNYILNLTKEGNINES